MALPENESPVAGLKINPFSLVAMFFFIFIVNECAGSGVGKYNQLPKVQIIKLYFSKYHEAIK